MSTDRGKVAEEALGSLDELVKATVQTLTAYQIAGGAAQSGEQLSRSACSEQPVEAGVKVLRDARIKQEAALRSLRQQLQVLANDVQAPTSASLPF